MHACSVTQSCPTLCDPVDYNLQVPLAMRFSRKQYWSELPFLSPWYLPDPGIESLSPVPPVLAGGFLTPSHLGSPRKTMHGIKTSFTVRVILTSDLECGNKYL